MANVVSGMVTGTGITLPSHIPSPLYYFTEVEIPEVIMIPKIKYDIEHLIAITVDVEATSVHLIKTPSGISLEGQILTGYKLNVELKLRQKIKYAADEPAQSVHVAYFENIVGSIFIVVDRDLANEFEKGNVVVTPYVEDIYIQLRDNSTVFKNIIVLVNARSI